MRTCELQTRCKQRVPSSPEAMGSEMALLLRPRLRLPLRWRLLRQPPMNLRWWRMMTPSQRLRLCLWLRWYPLSSGPVMWLKTSSPWRLALRRLPPLLWLRWDPLRPWLVEWLEALLPWLTAWLPPRLRLRLRSGSGVRCARGAAGLGLRSARAFPGLGPSLPLLWLPERPERVAFCCQAGRGDTPASSSDCSPAAPSWPAALLGPCAAFGQTCLLLLMLSSPPWGSLLRPRVWAHPVCPRKFLGDIGLPAG